MHFVSGREKICEFFGPHMDDDEGNAISQRAQLRHLRPQENSPFGAA
jgi:hypothetical protein